MTKSEAYDILHKRISDMCINDVAYGIGMQDKEDFFNTMLVILADINAVSETLDELVTNGGDHNA